MLSPPSVPFNLQNPAIFTCLCSCDLVVSSLPMKHTRLPPQDCRLSPYCHLPRLTPSCFLLGFPPLGCLPLLFWPTVLKTTLHGEGPVVTNTHTRAPPPQGCRLSPHFLASTRPPHTPPRDAARRTRHPLQYCRRRAEREGPIGSSVHTPQRSPNLPKIMRPNGPIANLFHERTE